MGKIAEQWEPFEIQVTIEGETKSLLVVPDREEPKYQIFRSAYLSWVDLAGDWQNWKSLVWGGYGGQGLSD